MWFFVVFGVNGIESVYLDVCLFILVDVDGFVGDDIFDVLYKNGCFYNFI